MITVEIEATSGPTCFNVVARARSIRQALGMVEAHYSCDQVRLVHPIDPEAFFEEPVATEELSYRDVSASARDGLMAAG